MQIKLQKLILLSESANSFYLAKSKLEIDQVREYCTWIVIILHGTSILNFIGK